jgi:hypothetical protein
MGTTTPTGYRELVTTVGSMSASERTERFRELELLERSLAAEKAAIVAEVDHLNEHQLDGHRSIAGWIRANANPSEGTVRDLRRISKLCNAEPDVGDELLSGRIGADQAAELGRAFSNPRCGDELSDSLDLLLEHANGLKFHEFRQVVKRWEILADLNGAHEDRGHNIDARRAGVVAGANGVDISATGGTALDATEMAAIFNNFVDAEFKADLEELTARLGPDAPSSELARTDTQRRFDALVTLFRTANNSPLDNTPAPVEINVIVDQHTYETALATHHLADEPTDLLPPGPVKARCHTDRGVPLLPDDTVAATFGGWIRRLVVNSQNVVINRGRRTRGFTGDAATAARLLATTCEIPGCTIAEHRSQLDHLTEWHQHGPSDQDNAGITCGPHNRHKHRQRWQARRDHNGRLRIQRADGTWILPVGVDPPTDTDFLTDQQTDQIVRDRLDGLRP